MHIVYLFRHSQRGDEELRYSLRSVAAHAPFVTKVFIFGDRPAWVSSDRRLIDVIPHDAIAWIRRYRTPVVNTFLMHYLVALLPELNSEYLLFCDDYILLRELTPEVACRPRYVQDLAQVKNRGKGLFKEALWRTHDLLKRFKYPTLNFEIHVPLYLRKAWVLAAVRDFEDFITADRFHGPLAQTAIMNHLRKRVDFTPNPPATNNPSRHNQRTIKERRPDGRRSHVFC